jgi:hypothetical protein
MPAPGTALPTPGASDPVIGDTFNTVISALGRPNGSITNPDKSILLIYERGTILIADGKVAEVKLMPMTAYNAKLTAEAAVEAERQANAARANALLQMLLADPTYQAMSTRDRMATLSKFDREHSGSDAKKYLSDLSAVYSAEQMAQAHIQDLQNQVNQFKSQASLYQQQVLDAQQRLDNALKTAAVAKAQSDAARQQNDLILQNAAGKSPLLVNPNNVAPGSNTPGSKVGPSGSVLISNGFGTTPAPAPNPGSPALVGNSTAPAGMHYVLEPDGHTIDLVPDNATSGR